MERRRIFIDKVDFMDGTEILTGPAFKYVARVLRRTTGDPIDLVDNAGCLHRCVINAVGKQEITVKVLDTIPKPAEKWPRVVICVSPIKGPRMDWLIEKATELGAARIIPTIFKRTVVKPGSGESGKLERWKRISIEAARQSGRFTTPEINEPIFLNNMIPLIQDCANRIVLHEKEVRNTLADFFTPRREDNIVVVTGPEGGIDEAEMVLLKNNGFQSSSLGDTVLRSETAPLVILSIILYEYARMAQEQTGTKEDRTDR